ncbi:MAG: transcriptional regulator [Terracidiphilus sp.]|jgi:DNA-binding winged helix-turn-helix (wHTH) protein
MANKPFVFRFGDVEVREREFSFVKAGEVLAVEPKAFRVLLFLLRNPQKLITKEELLNAVWGETAVSENSLTRSIALLRRLLGDDTHQPRYIETAATVGYRFVCKVEASEDASGILESSSQPPANGNIAEVAANPQTESGTLNGGGDPSLRQSMTDPKLSLHGPKDESASGGSTITVARRYFFRWLAAGATIMLLAGLLIGLAV